MKPWGNRHTKIKSFYEERHSQRAFGSWLCSLWLCIRWESAAPTELKKCVETISPGLAPWAMQEYRPKRAHCGLV